MPAGWTEETWRNHGYPGSMLDFVRLKARKRDRKLRLFACALCRALLWPYLIDARSRAAVEAAERFADGILTLEEMKESARAAKAAERALKHAPLEQFWAAALASTVPVKWGADAALIWGAAVQLACGGVDVPEEVKARSNRHLCDLIREVFGPTPFRLVTVRPTPTVTSLARGIEAAGTFADLPVLGDALEEAGCDDRELLDHLRSGGEHYRGCWALDAVLGRE
jgi:hypothetical protein